MEQLNFKRFKPILQPTYPILPPERTEVDYRNSKAIDVCAFAAPEADKPSSSIDLEWVYAKRELRSVTDYLAQTRKNAAVEYELNNAKWASLQAKEDNLRTSFIRFEQFVVENEDKRRRARRKIIEEKLLQEQRERMLSEALDQQKVLTDVKQKMDQKTKGYRIYEEFLNRVVISDPLHYKIINDVIKRHVVLMETKDQVSEKRAKDMDALDLAKMEYNKLLDEKDLELMMLNSHLVELIVRHDQARNRALQWESIVTEIKDITETKQMELTSVRVSMWNMYKQMCGRKGAKLECAKDEFEAQLMFIKKTLFELKKVRAVVEKIVGKNYAGIAKPKKKHTKFVGDDKRKKKIAVQQQQQQEKPQLQQPRNSKTGSLKRQDSKTISGDSSAGGGSVNAASSTNVQQPSITETATGSK